MAFRFVGEGKGDGEVAVFSAQRLDCRSRADLIESAIPCHGAQVVGSYQGSNPLHLTVLTSKSEDYTTAPQHLLSGILLQKILFVVFSFIFLNLVVVMCLNN